MKTIEVCYTPNNILNYKLSNKIIVVIDILRASSTIVTLFSKEATSITPIETLDKCKEYKNKGYVIMAERMGEKVKGFDYGNSPSKILKKDFKNKKIAIATSNGTKTILKTRKSKMTLIGSFLNLKSIVNYLDKQNDDILLVCSGWQGSINLEDTLCAGAIISSISNYTCESDSTIIAKNLYESNKDDIFNIMKKSSHAKRLSSNDNLIDIKFCSQIDKYDLIPYLDNDKLKLL